jgi:arginase family enzyme
VSSTGTRVDGGLNPDEVRRMILETMKQESLVSLDVVEFNPLLGDPDHSMKAI